MNLVTLAFRNIRRRISRSAIVTLSVGLSVASALSLVALANSIEAGASESLDERGADLMVMQRDASDIFSGFIPEGAVERAAAVAGVAGVAGELVMFAPIERQAQKLVSGWSADSFMWKRMPIKRGRPPAKGERRVAILGANVAEVLHKNVGDQVDILDAAFIVVGIADYQSALNRSTVIVPLRDLQEIAYREGQVTLLEIRLDPQLEPERTESARAELERLGPLLVTPTDQLLLRDRNLTVMKATSRSVSLIALAMGGLSVLNALLMAVQERTREIGVMMAIGWARSRTMAAIVIEGALIGLAGCLIGIPLAFAVCFFFRALPTVGDILSFHPTPGMVAPTLAAAILLCALGSLYPAWRAASMTPADALRHV